MGSLEIRAFGHPNVTARHRTTMELTREREITRRADCVVGVRASHGAASLPTWLRRHLLSGGWISLTLSVGGMDFTFYARGDGRLTLRSEDEIVVRRSLYVDDRTVAVEATASAADVPRPMVRALRRGLPLILVIKPKAGRTPGDPPASTIP